MNNALITLLATIVGGVLSFLGTIISNIYLENRKRHGDFLVFVKQVSSIDDLKRGTQKYRLLFVNEKQTPVIITDIGLYEEKSKNELYQYVSIETSVNIKKRDNIVIQEERHEYGFDSYMSGVIKPKSVKNIPLCFEPEMHDINSRSGILLLGIRDGSGKLTLYRTPDCSHMYVPLNKKMIYERNYRGKITPPFFRG